MSAPLPTAEDALARHITARWSAVKAAVEAGSPLLLARALLGRPENRSAGRWCARCGMHGSHHTDQHDEFVSIIPPEAPPMTYAARYRHLKAHRKAQRAYARSIAAHGLPAILAPYTIAPTVPAQRRRVVIRERISA